MKRVFVLILMIAMGTAMLGPLSSTTWAANAPGSSGGGAGTPAPAAAKDPLIATDPKCPNGVRIALPIFGSANCVNNGSSGGGAIIGYLKTVLQFLSGAVGLVIILMLVVAGIQYITSIGDPGSLKAAKNRIVNAITALLLFLMMFAILSFLVPGGIF